MNVFYFETNWYIHFQMNREAKQDKKLAKRIAAELEKCNV